MELKSGEAWVVVALPSWADSAPQQFSGVSNHRGTRELPLQSAILSLSNQIELNKKKTFKIAWKHAPKNELCGGKDK